MNQAYPLTKALFQAIEQEPVISMMLGFLILLALAALVATIKLVFFPSKRRTEMAP